MPLRRQLALGRPRSYLPRMALALLRLLSLVALLLMPLSMASGPASARATASASSGHCDERQKPADAPTSQQVHCTGCSALPATEAPPAIAELRPEMPIELSLAQLPAGLIPETATPPPKMLQIEKAA